MVRTLKSFFSCPAALLGFFLLGFPLPAHASEPVPALSPHEHFQRPETCTKCHLRSQDALAPDRFSTDSNAICLDCHRKESLGRSHPVGVGPRGKPKPMKIPEAFRLDAGGRLMCLTCHTAHGPFLSPGPSFPGQEMFTPGNGGGPGYKTFFLRRTSPEDGFAALCRACHGDL